MTGSTGPLDLFCKLYQCAYKSQRVNLSKVYSKYLFPSDHKDYSKVMNAVSKFHILKEENNVENFCKYHRYKKRIFKIKDINWLLRISYDHKNKKYFSASLVDKYCGGNETSTLRVIMNHHMKKVVEEKNLNIVVPDEYFAISEKYLELAKEDKEFFKYLFVISEKLDIFKYKEAIKKINSFDEKKQKEIAEDICKFIYYSGVIDVHMNNFVLTKNDKIAIVDTEGIGFIRESSEKLPTTPLVDLRLKGLYKFLAISEEFKLPEVFIKTGEKYYYYAKLLKTVKTISIILSILCPIIPLTVLICSLAYAKIKNISENNILNKNIGVKEVVFSV